MLRTLFPCCAPSLLPWHSVHVTSDVTSLWRTCCELVASMLRPTSKHSVANTFSMLRTLFPCCAPPSSPDIVYILRAMLRACGEHVAITIQTSDARLVGSWEASDFFPRQTSNQEHYQFLLCFVWLHAGPLDPFLCLKRL
jgi:hypothetical protein